MHSKEEGLAIAKYAAETKCTLDELYDFIEKEFKQKWSRTDPKTIEYIKFFHNFYSNHQDSQKN